MFYGTFINRLLVIITDRPGKAVKAVIWNRILPKQLPIRKKKTMLLRTFDSPVLVHPFEK